MKPIRRITIGKKSKPIKIKTEAYGDINLGIIRKIGLALEVPLNFFLTEDYQYQPDLDMKIRMRAADIGFPTMKSLSLHIGMGQNDLTYQIIHLGNKSKEQELITQAIKDGLFRKAEEIYYLVSKKIKEETNYHGMNRVKFKRLEFMQEVIEEKRILLNSQEIKP
jgi:hypothetical protein